MTKQRRILYVQYTNPCGYPPLEHSSRILADAGWKVQFLGTGAFGANDLIFPPHANIVVRFRPFQAPGWKQKVHYLRFVIWCFFTCIVWRPQIAYCSDVWSTPVGLLVALLLRIRVAYHEHDTPGPPANALMRAFHWSRKRLARRALVCVIPQQERLHKFNETIKPRRAICVWNCPARDEVVGTERTTDQDEFVLWYHGSLNANQFPLTVIDALASLPANVRVHFAGYETTGHQGFVKELLERANRLGVGSRVEYVGTPPTRVQLYAMASQADVGLALFERAFREPMAGASNKPFDYLACGLPVLLTNTEEWSSFFLPFGCGMTTNPESAEAITATVREMLQDRSRVRAMGEAGRRRVLSNWNYETQFRPVKALLESL